MTRAVFLAFLGLSACTRAEAAPPNPGAAGATPILVELFTSEGCSSCPSADAVATKLETTQPVAGARVIVLAHHVDYWNQLGWPDPWSTSAASQRQRAYGKGTYTPQAIVDGDAAMVGSGEGALTSAIAEAAKRPHSKVDLAVTAIDKTTFDVTVNASGDTFIAVVQDRGKVAVPRGENAGKTLEHTSIVRSLVNGPKARITLPAAVNAPDGTGFSIVAFVVGKDKHVDGTAIAPAR